LSPTHFPSNTPSDNDPSSGAVDELAKAFYQTFKKPEYASKRIEAALKNFCDDFSLEKATSGERFHPSLETLSNYLQESADTNFSDLNDRFRRGRLIIAHSIETHLGTNEAATIARQIADASFVTDMGTCLTKQKLASTIEEHYLKLEEHHIDPFLERTESSLQYLHILEKNTPNSLSQLKEAQARLISDCEVAAKRVKAHLHQWAYLLHKHFPSLISDAVDELKELAPEVNISFSDKLRKEIFDSFEEKFLDALSQIVQEKTAEVDLCVTAIKSVFSSDISEQNG
jgi:hypothetical protein